MTDLILETGKVKARNGCEVRIYATDAGGDYPVHGAVKNNHGWEFETWTLEGFYYADGTQGDQDLVPTPQPQYFNVYQRPDGGVFIGKFHDNTDYLLAVRSTKIQGTYKYLDGEITKIEESSNDD